MRVAFISFAFSEYSIRWVNGIADHADVLLALSDSEDEVRKLLDKRVRFIAIPAARIRHVFEQIRNMWRLSQELRRFRPDVIHLQQGFIWFNLLQPFLFRYPLVVTVHDPLPHRGDEQQKQPQFIFRLGFDRASRLIVHGKRIKEACIQLGLPAEKIAIIPHVKIGDDEGSTTPITSKTILFFGRIWEYKGLDILIRAEPIIAASVPDMKIMIAGTGEPLDRYRALMTDPSRYIIHNTYIPDEMRAELFTQAAVVVLPYVEATQSGVIPLAYTYARPVVATRVGALPDAIDEGVTGLLVPPSDVQAFADAVIRLLENRELAQAMGEAGRRKINLEGSPEAVGRLTMEVYRSMLHP